MTRELERLNSVMEGPHLSVHAFAEFSTVEQCSRMEFGSCRLPQLCSEETRPNFGFGSSEKDRCACALHFHSLTAPGQQISLQNQASGAAPVVVETDGDLTYNYGLNALSDARLKENIREADLEELQAIFDATKPKCYDRTDVPHKSRLGFVAQGFSGRRRHGHRVARRPGADDAGLCAADRSAVGSLQAAAGASGGAGEVAA